MYRNESAFQSHLGFSLRKVPLGTDQHQCIFARAQGRGQVVLPRLGERLVAVRNQLPTGKGLGYKRMKCGQRSELGAIGFERLLHGGRDHLLAARG